MKPAAVNLAKRIQRIFVATANSEGLPHIAVASGIDQISGEKISVSAWFCPGTIENLDQNRLVSLVIWDSSTDEGYQLLGKVDQMEEEVMMNGYTPELEKKGPIPQIKWKLVVQVEKTLGFTRAPHSDIAE